MTRPWEDIAASLESLLTGPTSEQRFLASALKIKLAEDVPAFVAAAILGDSVAPAIMRPRSRREPNVDDLERIEAELDIDPAPVTGETSAEVVSAWIGARYIEKRLRGLRVLQPEEGDIVRTLGSKSDLMLISSVDGRGRVHMKGGRGLSAWPDNLQFVARRGLSDDYDALAAEVANRLKNEKSDYGPNSLLLDKIKRYRLDTIRPRAAALHELEDLLDAGDGSEGPLQKLIERHPQLLAGLVLGNNGTYVIPQQALGAEFRADFLVLGINSIGPQWVLVELEASKHRLHNKDESLTSAVRHAVGQIQEWREWLTSNVVYAQQELGLHGLTNKAHGLVVIGRAGPTVLRDPVRSQVREQQDIQIHSWDWILRQARQLADGAFPAAVYAEGIASAETAEELIG
ncbi:Shedu anti-phage system protein SduA domain-containing protein [Psychromicrobium xiongbiense]|uniref:Shedu anti-phage system protein SduA domain-containing protein n=1 Tax=Psychromicrobium xiongbiense TaxID=3051184 RepID=UPI002557233E|nr:Shedu anti-phage system protein SduA domain-containing protein [Psychromicrobium sp. YIM S02556]